MTKEELKALGLTEEQVQAITEDLGKNYVAKHRFNEVNESAKAASEQFATMQKEMDAIKKQNKDNADLVAQIDAMKEQQKQAQADHEKAMTQMKIDNAVEVALMSAGARNTKAAKALLNLADAQLDGDEVKGLQKQIETLKAEQAYLFNTVKEDVTQVHATYCHVRRYIGKMEKNSWLQHY